MITARSGELATTDSPSRSLLILLTTVVALPAAALIFLGVQIVQQDRELAHQRRTEILGEAADRAVRALQADLAGVRTALTDPRWPSAPSSPGSVHVQLTRGSVRVTPSSALAYLPEVPSAEPPVEPFHEVDQVEVGTADLSRALAMTQPLVSSSDRWVRAGALVRQGRMLRQLGRAEEALAAYAQLAHLTDVTVNGLPADLQARRTRCVVLAERARIAELRREAAAIRAELDAGRWALDRASYRYVSGLLDEWSASPERRATEREAVAAAVDWLHQAWSNRDEGTFPGTGTHAIHDPGAATIIWWVDAESVRAFIAGATYVEQHWRSHAQDEARPAILALTGAAAGLPDDAALIDRRLATNTGLPWTLVASLPPEVDVAALEGRRRTLLAALAAVLVLVAAGAYAIIRSRTREIALAGLQSDFVTAVSHEFRTPLTALRQYGELLDDPAALTAETRQRYHRAQMRATGRLHRLVESLLDFGRMEAGKRPYRFEPVDAALLVRDVVEEFRGELDDSQMVVQYTADEDVPVSADPEALSRALWNLLDNAVKYGGTAQKVDVTVERTADGAVMAVRDGGIGIPPAEQARVFQKFMRGAAAVSGRIRGTGIGLAMVQHIVTAHGGTVRVESEPGRGSTFSITLPCLASQTAKPPSPLESA